MTDRFASFAAFFPFYIGEHRHPLCRKLHFVGTTGFLATTVACLVARPLVFGGAVLLAALLLVLAWRMEARRSSAPVLLLMIALVTAANPAVLGGVVFAYACAWVGHFRIEHNRPATFTYPLWSLAGDFRMWGLMLRGRLWSGDGAEIAGPVADPAT